ncbi:MAG: hypothetical protein HY077_16570 [Elusimicrobia bacterium]|nr:hypothetical protein [Elusimicrobiota bacterium]
MRHLSSTAGLALAVCALICASAAAGPPEVAVDSQAVRAYITLNSAFIDLNTDLSRPATAEVELGRELFFDPRLSGNKAMSCATCHNPALAWADGLPRARGLNHQELSRNTPSLFNVFRNIAKPFAWDGKAKTMEDSVLTALESRLEMSRDPKQLIVELNRIPGYVERFSSVYGMAGITRENIAAAIVAFVKAEIRPGPTRFDEFGRDRGALTESERGGLKLFVGKARCQLCHTGIFFSDDFFHNVGLNPTPGVVDPGRYGVVPQREFWRSFRTPPLRNVSLTAPYMHDGSLKTLRDVVEFYDRGGDFAENRDPQIKPLSLTPKEKDDLVAFLNALTAPQRPVTLPVLPLEEGPQSLAQARDWSRERLRRIEFDLKKRDLTGVYANATAVFEYAGAAQRLPQEPGPDGRPTAGCFSEVEKKAWELAHLAETSAAAADLEKASRRLTAAAEGCPARAAADPAAVSGGKLAASCAASFSVEDFVKDFETRSYARDEVERIEKNVPYHLLFYYEYKTILAENAEGCDRLKPFTKLYAGNALPSDKVCREKFHEDMLARDLITNSPRFTEDCKLSLRSSYEAMSEENAAAACRIMAQHKSEPEVACSKLVPVYLSDLKQDSCVNIFKRLFPRKGDPALCRYLEGSPSDWMGRCLGLVAFNNAFWSKDIKLCGDHELCYAFMGDKARSLGPRAERLKAAVCGLPPDAASGGRR